MKTSFKFHVFVRLVLLTFLIIFANRYIAQNLLISQLQEHSIETMGKSLHACSSRVFQKEEFISCSKQLHLGVLINSEMDYYEVCDSTSSLVEGQLASLCSLANRPQLSWTRFSKDVDHAKVVNDQQTWQLVKLAGVADSPKLLMPQSYMDQYMDEIWALRDKNLVFVLPTIFVLLSLMSLYIVRVVFTPIRNIEQAVAALDSKSLNQPIGLPTQFLEFRTFVAVFEDLRHRLADSFVKARRFASDASHELRTPLAILRGNSEQLIEELAKGSGAQIRASRMNEEIDRLIEITEKLLMLSRADANCLVEEPTEVDLTALLEELVEEAEGLPFNLRVSGRIEPGVFWWGDRTLIRQCIYNLYSNALKYNVAHGWVDICLSTQGDRFVFTIENPCSDIPADLSERAFERFYRGDAAHTRQVDGLGLGLSLCEEIVKLHDGVLTLLVKDKQRVCIELKAPCHRKSVPPAHVLS
ncbi:sensor histidine kinase [Limnohabitans sp.]|uniref:sensor histidine kinase n=1 Tax=Limnohabitans sp. TaxID=1907725 RepID=UPI0038BAED36